jgi:hypothetical protein
MQPGGTESADWLDGWVVGTADGIAKHVTALGCNADRGINTGQQAAVGTITISLKLLICDLPVAHSFPITFNKHQIACGALPSGAL